MTGLAIEKMARLRKRAGGRPKGESPPKRNIITLRGTEEWRDWLNELADSCYLPSTSVIDQALVEFAKARGFKKPMPKRTS